MLSPITYHGLNENGEEVITRTGVDATTQINPAEVKKAIENVKKVFEDQMNNIAQALTDISADASDAVIVQGTNMGKTIEDTATVLKTLAGQVTNGIDQLYDSSVKVHDALQEVNNNDAHNICLSGPGVKSVIS